MAVLTHSQDLFDMCDSNGNVGLSPFGIKGKEFLGQSAGLQGPDVLGGLISSANLSPAADCVGLDLSENRLVLFYSIWGFALKDFYLSQVLKVLITKRFVCCTWQSVHSFRCRRLIEKNLAQTGKCELI